MIDLQVYHFHPCSSNWNELAFLNVMLNLGEESWVPALYPLELLGLDKKQNKLKIEAAHICRTFKAYTKLLEGNHLRASKNKLWVLLH